MKTINNSVGTRSNYPFKMPVHLGLPTLFLTEQEGKMESRNGTIYIATNLKNGKQYVGQTTRTLQRRIYEHKTYDKSGILHKAIQKYDNKNFKWIFFSCPEEDLDWTETFLLKELNTLSPNGYNLETGGNKNKHLSEETKGKLRNIQQKWHKNNPEARIEHSKKLKGRFVGKNNPNFGKKFPEISERNKKRVGILHPNFSRNPSLEEREKIKLGLKKYFKENPNAHKGKNNPMYNIHRFGIKNPMYGRKWTKEQKEKQSEKLKKQFKNGRIPWNKEIK